MGTIFYIYLLYTPRTYEYSFHPWEGASPLIRKHRRSTRRAKGASREHDRATQETVSYSPYQRRAYTARRSLSRAQPITTQSINICFFSTTLPQSVTFLRETYIFLRCRGNKLKLFNVRLATVEHQKQKQNNKTNNSSLKPINRFSVMGGSESG